MQKKEFIDSIQSRSIENKYIAMVFSGNEYTHKKVKEVFEPRSFVVDLSLATGTTLQLPKNESNN